MQRQHKLVHALQVCCNILVAVDLIDDTLLCRGLMPALHHVIEEGMLAPGAHMLPRAARVWAQAVQAGAGLEDADGQQAAGSQAYGMGATCDDGIGSSLDICR